MTTQNKFPFSTPELRAELDEHALGVNVSEIEAPFELKDMKVSF